MSWKGEASTWPPHFTQVEMKLQHQESPSEDAPVCSANSPPPLGAEAFQAPLEEQIPEKGQREDTLLCTVLVTWCFVWLCSMNRKLDLHV